MVDCRQLISNLISHSWHCQILRSADPTASIGASHHRPRRCSRNTRTRPRTPGQPRSNHCTSKDVSCVRPYPSLWPSFDPFRGGASCAYSSCTGAPITSRPSSLVVFRSSYAGRLRLRLGYPTQSRRCHSQTRRVCAKDGRDGRDAGRVFGASTWCLRWWPADTFIRVRAAGVKRSICTRPTSSAGIQPK
jgi:hypothetical protein